MNTNAPSDAVLEYVQDLSDDAVAAIELLGESPVETVDGKTSIRIPADFPVPEGELDAFYADAEAIGLLHTIGTNTNGIRQRVWELNQTIYDEVLLAMSLLGRPSPIEAPVSSERSLEEDRDSDTDEEKETSEEALDADFRPVPLPELREELVQVEAARASSRAESEELKRQYQATVQRLAKAMEQLAELRQQVTELHERRSTLKQRVKAANIAHTDACRMRKTLRMSIRSMEQREMDSVVGPALDLLAQEAERTGFSLEEVLAELRKRSTSSK